MAQSKQQQELPLPKDGNRILHMSDAAQEVMPGVREWAKGKGIEEKLDAALDYCRTFSKGPEEEWHSHLHTDMFFNPERPSFTCVVSRRGEPRPYADNYADRQGLVMFMHIGMIWDERDQDWSFHS